eukprot:g25918.t1
MPCPSLQPPGRRLVPGRAVWRCCHCFEVEASSARRESEMIGLSHWRCCQNVNFDLMWPGFVAVLWLTSGCSSLMRTCESWLQSLNLLQTARIWRARSTVLLYSAAMNTCEEPATPTERLSEVSQDRPSQLWRVATALLMDMQQAEVLPNLITKLDLIGVARCRGVSLAVE